jgi:hypothetical protein
VNHIEREFKKIKPSTFDGESRTREEVEAWLLGIWLHDPKLAKGLKEKQMEWSYFNKYFKKQYLS